jgi:hypothetical protein
MCEIIDYISAHPGCSKPMIVAGTNLTIHQVNNRLVKLKGEVQTVITGKGGGRTGTYYASGKSPTGGRIVHAGDLLRKKYGVLSPELRKVAHSGVRSYMEGNGYD